VKNVKTEWAKSEKSWLERETVRVMKEENPTFKCCDGTDLGIMA